MYETSACAINMLSHYILYYGLSFTLAHLRFKIAFLIKFPLGNGDLTLQKASLRNSGSNESGF